MEGVHVNTWINFVSAILIFLAACVPVGMAINRWQSRLSHKTKRATLALFLLFLKTALQIIAVVLYLYKKPEIALVVYGVAVIWLSFELICEKELSRNTIFSLMVGFLVLGAMLGTIDSKTLRVSIKQLHNTQYEILKVQERMVGIDELLVESVSNHTVMIKFVSTNSTTRGDTID